MIVVARTWHFRMRMGSPRKTDLVPHAALVESAWSFWSSDLFSSKQLLVLTKAQFQSMNNFPTPPLQMRIPEKWTQFDIQSEHLVNKIPSQVDSMFLIKSFSFLFIFFLLVFFSSVTWSFLEVSESSTSKNGHVLIIFSQREQHRSNGNEFAFSFACLLFLLFFLVCFWHVSKNFFLRKHKWKCVQFLRLMLLTLF